MGLHLLFGGAVFGASVVEALAFPGPQPTSNLEVLPQNAWSPKPTAGPDVHALFRRQTGLPSSYILAPDNTCGFVNGNSRSAFACMDDDARCAFIPASGKVPGAAACCSGGDCMFRISCLDRSEMDDCDKDCQADSLTLKCTGAARFCNTVVFPLGVTDYYCGARRITSALTAETTHSGDKSRSMSTVKPTTTTSTTKKSTSSTSKSSASSTSGSSSSSSGADATSSTKGPETTSATDTARAGAATETTAPTSTAAPAPSAPVGAIVGGVIGGIALVAFIALGGLFLRQHKKKTEAAAAAAPPGSFMSQKRQPEPGLPSQQPPVDPFADQSTHSFPNSSTHLSSATATPSHMYSVPAAAAGAGAAAAAYNSYNHLTASNSSSHNSAGGRGYPDPSPMSTPSSSPSPQYQHQPHAPPPLAPPAYLQPQPQSQFHHQQQQQQQARGADETWASLHPDPPDRQATSTPVSTYNNTTPVSPASALGPMPGDPPEQRHHYQQQQTSRTTAREPGLGMDMDAVPLSLLPGGRGGYRPYRPSSSSPSASVPASASSASAAPARSPSAGTGTGMGPGPGTGANVGMGPGTSMRGTTALSAGTDGTGMDAGTGLGIGVAVAVPVPVGVPVRVPVRKPAPPVAGVGAGAGAGQKKHGSPDAGRDAAQKGATSSPSSPSSPPSASSPSYPSPVGQGRQGTGAGPGLPPGGGSVGPAPVELP